MKRYSVDEAFEYCRQLAVSHYENFPVGSLLIPKRKRKHVWAIYAFARVADDFSDEGRHAGETAQDLEKRLRQLDAWEIKLDHCALGQADHPIFVALAQTLRELPIPVQLLKDLLAAYRMDVQKKRHENFEALLVYCRYSANPVGRLVLHLFEYDDKYLFEQSDAICTALQLTNFWQDVSVDLEKDRIYIPQDQMARFGVTEDDLRAGRGGDKFEALMRYCALFTLEKFNAGLPLCSRVNRDLKLEMRATWAGGTAILRKICENRYSVLQRRPVITKFDKIKLLVKILWPAPLKRLALEEMEKR